MPIDDDPSQAAPSDDAWLAALAGRETAATGSADARAAHEGLLMRDALRRWTPAVDGVPPHDPERVAALIERARLAGLLEQRRATSVDARPGARRTRRLSDRVRAWWTANGTPGFGARPALATALAVFAIVALVVVMRPAGEQRPDEDATVRTAPDAMTLLQARDPEALRRDIVEALARQGVKTTTYSRFGRAGLDADLPRPLTDDVKRVLDRYRIAAPADGVLRVEIEAERR